MLPYFRRLRFVAACILPGFRFFKAWILTIRKLPYFLHKASNSPVLPVFAGNSSNDAVFMPSLWLSFSRIKIYPNKYIKNKRGKYYGIIIFYGYWDVSGGLHYLGHDESINGSNNNFDHCRLLGLFYTSVAGNCRHCIHSGIGYRHIYICAAEKDSAGIKA